MDYLDTSSYRQHIYSHNRASAHSNIIRIMDLDGSCDASLSGSSNSYAVAETQGYTPLHVNSDTHMDPVLFDEPNYLLKRRKLSPNQRLDILGGALTSCEDRMPRDDDATLPSLDSVLQTEASISVPSWRTTQSDQDLCSDIELSMHNDDQGWSSSWSPRGSSIQSDLSSIGSWLAQDTGTERPETLDFDDVDDKKHLWRDASMSPGVPPEAPTPPSEVSRLSTPDLRPLSAKHAFCACCDEDHGKKPTQIGKTWHIAEQAKRKTDAQCQ